MTLYNLLCLLGVPSLILSFILYIFKRISESDRKLRAVEKGIQALLRSQMITDYNHYAEKGYAPIYARENFENCWKNYHELGANGVMDDIHKKFTELAASRNEP